MKKIQTNNLNTTKSLLEKVGSDEFTRIGILTQGVRNIGEKILLPKQSETIIPRIELNIGKEERQVTTRINNESPFEFTGNEIKFSVDDILYSTNANIFESTIEGREGFNFSPVRDNGDSYVFDWVHNFCSHKCKFCFKEADWANIGRETISPDEEIEKNLKFIENFIENNKIEKDTIWLCTGSSIDLVKEREQHLRVIKALRNANYKGNIFISMVPPHDIINDRDKVLDMFKEFKDNGLDRFNSGLEVVGDEYRKKFIRGHKGRLSKEQYFDFLENAMGVFGDKNVGSCVLIGLEPHKNSLDAMEEFSKRGVQSVPTIYTSFVEKQLKHELHGDINDFIKTSLSFHEMVKKYDIEVFKSVFGLI